MKKKIKKWLSSKEGKQEIKKASQESARTIDQLSDAQKVDRKILSEPLMRAK